jgi:hypothetical protein
MPVGSAHAESPGQRWSVLTREGENQVSVGAAERMHSAITSRSTRARDSFPFIIESVDLLECCSRGPGYLRRWAADLGVIKNNTEGHEGAKFRVTAS